MRFVDLFAVQVAAMAESGAPGPGPLGQSALLAALPSESELIAALQSHSCWVCGTSAASHDANLSHMMTHLQMPVAAAPSGIEPCHQDHFDLDHQARELDCQAPYYGYYRVRDHQDQDLTQDPGEGLGADPFALRGALGGAEPQLFDVARPVPGEEVDRHVLSPLCSPPSTMSPGLPTELDTEMTHFKEPPRFSYSAKRVSDCGIWRLPLASPMPAPPRSGVHPPSTRGAPITLRDENANLEVLNSEAALLFLEEVGGELLVSMKQKLRGLAGEELRPGFTSDPEVDEAFPTSHPGLHEHEGGGLLVCAICLKVFSSKDLLLRHVETEMRALNNAARKGRKRKAPTLPGGGSLGGSSQGSIGRFPCTHCTRVFSRRVDLCAHVVVHRGQDQAGLQLTTGGDDRSFPCSECGKQFRRRDHLVDHQLTHTDKRAFGCPCCNMRFRRKSHLAAHERKHDPLHPQVKVVAASDLLPKQAAVQAAVQATADSTSGTSTLFKCCACFKTYSRRDKLKRHIRDIHVDTMPFVCRDCGTDCESQPQLASHLSVHEAERRACKCRVCGDTLPDRKALSLHSKDHKDVKATPNTTLKTTLKTTPKTILKTIPKTTLKTPPKTPLKTSPKTTLKTSPKTPLKTSPKDPPKISSLSSPKSSSNLSSKLTPNTPTKNTSSGVSNKSPKGAGKYSPISALVSNCRENKKFMCEKCGAVFIGECTLRVHLKIHSVSVKPFRCYWCGIKFAQKEKLWSHLQTHY